MDMLVDIIQIVCICGLLYGLYLSITYVEPAELAELAESCRRLKPRHFARDYPSTGASTVARSDPADRLLGL